MPILMIIIGLAITAIGIILQFAPWLLTWFGNLPGDIKYQDKDTTIFFPWVSMLVLSLAFSLVVKLFINKE